MIAGEERKAGAMERRVLWILTVSLANLVAGMGDNKLPLTSWQV